jgi:serine/threonine protein kinase
MTEPEVSGEMAKLLRAL